MNSIKEILSQHLLVDGYPLVMDIKRSYRSYLVDEETGKEYLDMFSMFASGSLGFNHPRYNCGISIIYRRLIHKIQWIYYLSNTLYSVIRGLF